MGSGAQIVRWCASFTVVAVFLFVNTTQFLTNTRLSGVIARGAVLLAWKSQEEAGFRWGRRILVHTDCVRVHRYTFRSSVPFRMNVDFHQKTYVWDSRAVSIETREQLVEFTVVLCQVSPDRMLVHLTGQGGIYSEFEIAGGFPSLKSICTSKGGVTHLDFGEIYDVEVGALDVFRFDVTAESI